MRTPIVSAAMLLAVAVVLSAGCTRRSSMQVGGAGDPLSPPSTQPQQLVGTLHGETGGWALAGDGATGRIELDVSRVKSLAKQLDGKRVSVRGMMRDRNFKDRGTVRLLVVDDMRPAPAPGQP